MIHHTPKKQDKFTQNWKQCWPFMIIAARFIMSSFQQARQLIRFIIWLFWGVQGMWYKENDQKCQLQERSTSNMTVHQRTQQCLFESSWQIVLSLLTLTIHLTYPLCNFTIHLTCPLHMFLCSSEEKWFWKEDFRWWRTSLEIQQMNWEQFKHIPQTVLQKVEKVVGTVCCCSGKLFWRGLVNWVASVEM